MFFFMFSCQGITGSSATPRQSYSLHLHVGACPILLLQNIALLSPLPCVYSAILVKGVLALLFDPAHVALI